MSGNSIHSNRSARNSAREKKYRRMKISYRWKEGVRQFITRPLQVKNVLVLAWLAILIVASIKLIVNITTIHESVSKYVGVVFFNRVVYAISETQPPTANIIIAVVVVLVFVVHLFLLVGILNLIATPRNAKEVEEYLAIALSVPEDESYKVPIMLSRSPVNGSKSGAFEYVFFSPFVTAEMWLMLAREGKLFASLDCCFVEKIEFKVVGKKENRKLVSVRVATTEISKFA